jgi:hypothetical protein
LDDALDGARESWDRPLAAGCERRPVAGAVFHVGQLGVRERGCLCVAATHLLGKAGDAVGVLSFDA